ncbi:hypothetical protein BESB_066950 [Besnoitia besnoiti]|uniref:CRAL-TRIO domain-containing protein n=1 Tax=Besnoitia besnoiti TaxID=94643 RepID=A0A2A9MGY3_BESBE|nr:hypothetical protein BESB_066950 [Besnoitia besnoiti]PFH34662.1 hypothetical protein BESB_066950 [Besnoitia besnoiti]
MAKMKEGTANSTVEDELLFREASEFVASGSPYGWDEASHEWRVLYGLFKVAACGPCTEKKVPPELGGLDRWKWESWIQASACHQSAATGRDHFLSLLAALKPDWEAEKRKIDVARGRASSSHSARAASAASAAAAEGARGREGAWGERRSPQKEDESSSRRSGVPATDREARGSLEARGAPTRGGEALDRSSRDAYALSTISSTCESSSPSSPSPVPAESTSLSCAFPGSSAFALPSGLSRASPAPLHAQGEESVGLRRRDDAAATQMPTGLPSRQEAGEALRGEKGRELTLGSAQAAHVSLLPPPPPPPHAFSAEEPRAAARGACEEASDKSTLSFLSPSTSLPSRKESLVCGASRPSLARYASPVAAASAHLPLPAAIAPALHPASRSPAPEAPGSPARDDGADGDVSGPELLVADLGEEGTVQKIGGSCTRLSGHAYYRTGSGRAALSPAARQPSQEAEAAEGDLHAVLTSLERKREGGARARGRAASFLDVFPVGAFPLSSGAASRESVVQPPSEDGDEERLHRPSTPEASSSPPLQARGSGASQGAERGLRGALSPLASRSPSSARLSSARSASFAAPVGMSEAVIRVASARRDRRETERDRERERRDREAPRRRRERRLPEDGAGDVVGDAGGGGGGRDFRGLPPLALPSLAAASALSSRLVGRRSGVVWKHSAGSLYHQWVQRWLVLDGFILKCYTDCNSVKPRTSVSLQHAIVEGLFAPQDNADLSGMDIWSFTVRWQPQLTPDSSWGLNQESFASTFLSSASFSSTSPALPAPASVAPVNGNAAMSKAGSAVSLPSTSTAEKETPATALGAPDEREWSILHLGLSSEEEALSWLDAIRGAIATCNLHPPALQLPRLRLPPPQVFLPLSRLIAHSLPSPGSGAPGSNAPLPADWTAEAPLASGSPSTPLSRGLLGDSATLAPCENSLKIPRSLRPLVPYLKQQVANLRWLTPNISRRSRGWSLVHMDRDRTVYVDAENPLRWATVALVRAPLEVVLQLLADPNLLAAGSSLASRRQRWRRSSWDLLDVFEAKTKAPSFPLALAASGCADLRGEAEAQRDEEGEREGDLIQLRFPLLPVATLQTASGAAASHARPGEDTSGPMGSHGMIGQALLQLLRPLFFLFSILFFFLPRSFLSFFILSALFLLATIRLLPLTRAVRMRLLRSGWTERSAELGRLGSAYIVARSPSSFRWRKRDKQRLAATCAAAPPVAWLATSSAGSAVKPEASESLAQLAKASGSRLEAAAFRAVSALRRFLRKLRGAVARVAGGLSGWPMDVDAQFVGWELSRSAQDPWGNTRVACFVEFSPIQEDALAAASLPPPRRRAPPSRASLPHRLFPGSLRLAAVGQAAARSPAAISSAALSLLLLFGGSRRGETAESRADQSEEKAATGGGDGAGEGASGGVQGEDARGSFLVASFLAAGVFEHIDWLQDLADLTKQDQAHDARAPAESNAAGDTSAASAPLGVPFLPPWPQVANRPAGALLAAAADAPLAVASAEETRARAGGSSATDAAEAADGVGVSRWGAWTLGGGWEDDVAVAAALNEAQHRRMEALMYAGPEDLSFRQRDALHILLHRYAAYGVFHRDVLLFLHLSNWNLQLADALIFQILLWRSEGCIDRLEARHVYTELSKCWGYVYNQDRLGRPCLVLRLANLCMASGGASDWKLALVFLIEEALKSMGRDVEQIVVLLDAKNVSFTDMSAPEILRMQTILQTFYPERLGLVLVINANWTARLLWLALRAQLSGTTRSKIFFVPSHPPERVKEFLLTFFEEPRLPRWCLQLYAPS